MSGVHHSVAHLFRAFCQPSWYAADERRMGRRQRLGFMVRLSPAILLVSVLASGSVSILADAAGLEADWLPGGAVRCAESLGMGVLWAALWSVPMGVVWGVVWGPAHYALETLFVPYAPLVSEAVLRAIGLWSPVGLALGIGLGVSLRGARGALWGVGVGWVLAVLAGVESTAAFLFPFVVGYFRLEWYVIDAGATLVQFIAARWNPTAARDYFRNSPIHWREPIWVPLIGLKPFLRLLDEQDVHAAFEECLFVILERPTQARIGRGALMEITARRLQSLNTVQEIAQAAEAFPGWQAEAAKLGVGRARLPAVLGRAVEGLATLSQHAAQHLTATLPHNRRRAVERLRQEADELAESLALESGGVARLFGAVARKWGGVAAARLAEIEQTDGAGDFIANPYVFGQPIEETETNLFVGRRDVVREIETSLLGTAQKPALVLWGPRRMGKTSVLLQLPRLLGPRFAAAFLDMQGVQVRESVGAFFHSVASAAVAALARRNVEIEGPDESALSSSPFGAFAAWLAEVEERLGEERYLLLCLDEFERLEASIRAGKLPEELMDQIRHTIQHHSQIVLLFAGSHRPDEMELNWPDALISTRLVRVSYLREDEARQLITEPVPGFGASYLPGSVEQILSVTRCQPNLVQAVCYELVNVLIAEGRREVRREDVDRAVEQAFETAHLYFAETWRQMGELQQNLLATISRRTEGVATDELVVAAEAEQSEAAAALMGLEGRSVVEQVSGRWRFAVPMVGEWVRRRGGPR